MWGYAFRKRGTTSATSCYHFISSKENLLTTEKAKSPNFTPRRTYFSVLRLDRQYFKKNLLICLCSQYLLCWTIFLSSRFMILSTYMPSLDLSPYIVLFLDCSRDKRNAFHYLSGPEKYWPALKYYSWETKPLPVVLKSVWTSLNKSFARNRTQHSWKWYSIWFFGRKCLEDSRDFLRKFGILGMRGAAGYNHIDLSSPFSGTIVDTISGSSESAPVMEEFSMYVYLNNRIKNKVHVQLGRTRSYKIWKDKYSFVYKWPLRGLM